MYAGDVPWQLPPVLDLGLNDYYKANIPGCPDLSPGDRHPVESLDLALLPGQGGLPTRRMSRSVKGYSHAGTGPYSAMRDGATLVGCW